MADNKVTIEIAVEGNAQVQFKKLSDSAAEFAAETKKSFLDTGRIFDNFIANLGSSAVSAGINVLKNGFSAFNDILSDSITAAIEQEDAINKLNTALVSTGQYSKESSESLQAFASEIQNTTKYSDDAVLSAASLITSISQLGGQDLRNATKAAVDLSAALGVDLETAAQKVAIAAEGQTIKIKGFKVEADTARSASENFANALNEISRFSGSAEKQVETFSGAITQLKTQYGEVLETIGLSITQSPAVTTAINAISKAFISFNAYLQENATAQKIVKDAVLFLIDSLYVAVNLTKDFAIFMLRAAQAATVSAGAISVFVRSSKGIDASVEQFKSLGQSIEDIKNSTALNDITTSIIKLRVSVQESTIATNEDLEAARIAHEDKKIMSQEQKDADALDAEEKAAQQVQAQAAALQSAQAYLTARNEMLKTADTKAAQDEIARNNARLSTIKTQIDQNYVIQDQKRKQNAEDEKKIEDQRLFYKQKILTDLATLTNAKTKELQVIGKAAAISATTIATYKGATEAYAALAGIPIVGPALATAAAAAAIVAGLANVAAINGTPLATGITQVPNGFQNDTFPARLSSGERVVSAPQNRDLTEFLAGSTGLTAKLDQLISVLSLERNQSIMIDGREIVAAVQSQVDSGRALNV